MSLFRRPPGWGADQPRRWQNGQARNRETYYQAFLNRARKLELDGQEMGICECLYWACPLYYMDDEKDRGGTTERLAG